MKRLAIACVLATSTAAAQTPAPDIGIEQRLNEHIPLDAPFRDEAGNAVQLRQYFDAKPVVLAPAYYRCPRLCSVALNNLAASLGRIDYLAGRDYAVVVFSIDPRETSELASAKRAVILDKHVPTAAAPGWHFLTGDEHAIQQLTGAIGFKYSYDAQRDLYAHASGVVILTPEGKIACYFFGVDYSPRDLRFGLEDASSGSIGAPITQPLRLLCFAYDPASGRYTLLTMRLIRIGGAITIAVMGFFLIRAWRHNRPLAT